MKKRVKKKEKSFEGRIHGSVYAALTVLRRIEEQCEKLKTPTLKTNHSYQHPNIISHSTRN